MLDNTPDFLVEIGTEELPPLALPNLADAFCQSMLRQLAEAGISHGDYQSYATPRRLALFIARMASHQPDQNLVRRGPAVQAAFDASGAPTKAAQGFAHSCGVAVGDLEQETTKAGSWLVYRKLQPGSPVTMLLPTMVEKALAELPIPKRMRWSDREQEFVRPVHWICMLLGTQTVPGQVMGLTCGNVTYGHRFHHPQAITVTEPSDYAEVLRHTGYVEPDFNTRRELIREQIKHEENALGLRARIDMALLDEVTALVEWSQALVCSFNEKFLEIPPEVLVETMQLNQRYFPLEHPDGTLSNRFIVIANIVSKDPEQIRRGNERVITPRFTDAAFFWEQDLRHPLHDNLAKLDKVIFQDRIGTLADKTARIGVLGKEIASQLSYDQDLVARAAELCKCDLVSAMVYEFTALQGIMGSYYAKHHGEPEEVASAITEHYLPRFSGDSLPATNTGRTIALADRLDTLVGIFGIGLQPTGTKDPYALRRASIAVLRILIETPLDLDLHVLLEQAVTAYSTGLLAEDTSTRVLAYMIERLYAYYGERQISSDLLEAVLARGITNPADIDKRIQALENFQQHPKSASLAAANKRISNILAKAAFKPNSDGINQELLKEPAEQRLATIVKESTNEVSRLVTDGAYSEILHYLAPLKDTINQFFADVMVNDEDPEVRQNRLQLLHELQALFLSVADLSQLRTDH